MSAPLLDAVPAPLQDPQGRFIRYLRLSVTDHCNFRCVYCSPAHWEGRSHLLETEEIVRLVGLFAGIGIRRVRITGGEPTVRKDLLEIVRGVRSVPGIEEIPLSTNASRLCDLAAPLKDAGVDSVNVSLDTLRPERFRALSRLGELGPVLSGIDAAAAVFPGAVKLNTVLVRGINEDEAPALVEWAWEWGVVPRFIELMPFKRGPEGLVPTAEVQERLATAGIELVPCIPQGDGRPRGPAAYWQGRGGRVGFIGAMTRNFCSACNRIRVSAAGELQACLGGHERVGVRQLMRSGASDAMLVDAIRSALTGKKETHEFLTVGRGSRLFPMMGIGG